jgi:hypothetical protein
MIDSNTRLKTRNFVHRAEHLWSKKNIQNWSSKLAIATTVTYAVCGGLSITAEHPIWYRVLTSCILLNLALFVSGLLCLRNGLSQRMPSGRNVWTLLGFALLSFFCGSIFFSAWELCWDLNPSGSLGDPFFLIFYLLLPTAMLLAIVRIKVRLETFQWFFLLAIASFATLIVTVFIILSPTSTVTANVDSTAVVKATENQSSNSQNPAASAPAIDKTKASASVPDWVSAVDSALKPHATNLNYFYVWSDIVLFCLAMFIVMGFWGGKFSQAWVINAGAVVCFYISDIWFAYAASHVENYQSGFFLEIFWTFGAILFGIAAATEFEFMLACQKNHQVLDSDPPTRSELF